VAVTIRMKRMGRKHRPFFRICAVDSRNPRDGRVLEELGTYDPMIDDTDARVVLKTERLGYWLGVGAQPSDKVKVFIKKYGANGERLVEQAAARDRLSLPKQVPPAPEPVYVPPPKGQAPAAPEPAAAAPEAKPADAPAAEGGEETSA
jgi:small subunit ribosomal protein S16